MARIVPTEHISENHGKLSGKSYRKHNALDKCLKCGEYDIDKAIVLCHDNVQEDGVVTYMPIYMTMFMQQRQKMEPIIYKLDLEAWRAL